MTSLHKHGEYLEKFCFMNVVVGSNSTPDSMWTFISPSKTHSLSVPDFSFTNTYNIRTNLAFIKPIYILLNTRFS